MHIQEAVPSREHFPLPTLGPKLEELGEEVRIGRGFQLLRYVEVATSCMPTASQTLKLSAQKVPCRSCVLGANFW